MLDIFSLHRPQKKTHIRTPWGQLLLFALVFLCGFTQASPNRSILVFGDSLSAGYGMTPAESWPALLAEELSERAPSVQLVNASVSGETTTGGILRLQKAVNVHNPDLVILELGGNDGLRGYPISKIKNNLMQMIELCINRDIDIILVGMVLPPNYGRRYTAAFEAVFRTIASETALTGFIPFPLDGVETRRDLIQADGIHPKAEAQPLIVDQVRPWVERWLNPI
jgi:acyl-CoA thioesterase I